MNNICRLCLCSGNIKMYEIWKDSVILNKLRILPVQVPYIENLPNYVCLHCLNKIDDIESFYKTISSNQTKLHDILKTGQEELEKFCLKNCTFKTDIEEIEISANNKENAILKDSDNCVDQSNLINKEQHLIINAKSEIEDFDDNTNNSSDDESSLLSIKEACKNDNGRCNNNINKSTKVNKSKTKKPSEKVDKNEINTGTKNQIFTNSEEYKCLTCFDLLNSQNDLLKHYHTEHTSKKDLLTTTSFSTVEEDGNQIFKCNKCPRVYDNLRGIKRHLVAHVEERPFICMVCGRTYKIVSDIVRHGRSHSGKKLDCSYNCGYSTVYTGALKDHEKRHRKEFKYKYKCEKCDKGFQIKTWYEEHQNVHNGVKPFVCNLCGISFHMSRYLTAHRSTVHPQSSDKKRYICTQCSLPCDSRNALTVHLKEHGILKHFLCDICGKTLSTKELLKFHKRMHLNEKPFSCSTCGKAFTKKFNLKLHEETHRDERSHECSKCGKLYKQRSTLKRHILKYCRAP